MFVFWSPAREREKEGGREREIGRERRREEEREGGREGRLERVRKGDKEWIKSWPIELDLETWRKKDGRSNEGEMQLVKEIWRIEREIVTD